MPILGGFLSTIFGSLFTYFSVKLGSKLALLGAFIAVSGGAWLATKAAVFAILASLTVFTPPAIVAGISYVIPANMGVCLAAVFLSDAILESMDFFGMQLHKSIDILAS